MATLRVRVSWLSAGVAALLALTAPLSAVAHPARVTAARGGTTHTTLGYPNAIVALGHSVLAAYDSDPARPEVDTRANSWATGTNPAVDSVYLRILKANPRIKGRAVNLAADGATVDDLVGQARRFARLPMRLRSGLAVIQIMDNDIRCDGTDTSNYAPFRAALLRAMGLISRSSPDARIFVISQIGRSTTLADALATTPESKARFMGTGRCDFFTPGGIRSSAHIRYTDAVIAGYEKQIIAVCAMFVHCRYGVMHAYVDRLPDLSEDLNHFAVTGQARLARLAWQHMFDFTDHSPPSSDVSLSASVNGGKLARFTAADLGGGPARVEYKLLAPGASSTTSPYQRYRAPVAIPADWRLIWRAVDRNGISEEARTVRG